MKNSFMLALVATGVFLASAPAVAKEQKPVKEAIMEQCGLRSVNAPWCDESLPLDTRQFQAAQLLIIRVKDEAKTEWVNALSDKRGIGFVITNAETGEREQSGRRAMKVVFRANAYTPTGESYLFPAILSPDGSAVIVLLPTAVDVRRWTIYVRSPRGDHAITTTGDLVEVKKGERKKDRLATMIPEDLETSMVSETTVVRRGDGSGFMEVLESTFLDHVVLNGDRRYSGLSGTFTPIDENSGSIAINFDAEDTPGKRLTQCGNLKADTGLLAIPLLGLAIRAVSLIATAAKDRC